MAVPLIADPSISVSIAGVILTFVSLDSAYLFASLDISKDKKDNEEDGRNYDNLE